MSNTRLGRFFKKSDIKGSSWHECGKAGIRANFHNSSVLIPNPSDAKLNSTSLTFKFEKQNGGLTFFLFLSTLTNFCDFGVNLYCFEDDKFNGIG